MSITDIIRAWKDEEYRRSLSAETQALVPPHPAGQIELTDAELKDVDGGTTAWYVCTGAVCAATANLCQSILAGGSCAIQTTGCCTHP